MVCGGGVTGVVDGVVVGTAVVLVVADAFVPGVDGFVAVVPITVVGVSSTEVVVVLLEGGGVTSAAPKNIGR